MFDPDWNPATDMQAMARGETHEQKRYYHNCCKLNTVVEMHENMPTRSVRHTIPTSIPFTHTISYRDNFVCYVFQCTGQDRRRSALFIGCLRVAPLRKVSCCLNIYFMCAGIEYCPIFITQQLQTILLVILCIVIYQRQMQKNNLATLAMDSKALSRKKNTNHFTKEELQDCFTLKEDCDCDTKEKIGSHWIDYGKLIEFC